jgi:lipopolysaccharide export system permease protein
VGPFVFALSALTSLLLLQYIARRFGDLVGRGLSWQIITEFFLLSIPFTLAMTLPMAVLVAVLYAFSRLASENEITAFKAGGVSTRALMVPALITSVFLAMFMLWFNDQLLPRANHELATLQMAILRTKPTFALKPQVINTIREGQLYLSAGQIDAASGLMKDVTIYDLSAADKRRTVYADSGTLAFADNRRDLLMKLHHGMILSAPTDRQGQLSRVYYNQDQLKIKDVANQFNPIDADTASKGDREMSVCEMQRGFETASLGVHRAVADSVMAMWRYNDAKGVKQGPMPKDVFPKTVAGGIGGFYCTYVTKYVAKLLKVKELHAEVVRPRQATQQQATQQQATQQDTTNRAQDTTNRRTVFAPKSGQTPVPVQGATPAQQPAAVPPQAAQPAASVPAQVPAVETPMPPVVTPGTVPVATPSTETGSIISTVDITDAKIRLDEARHRRNRYGIEIQKKFSLATACIVFVLVGAPIALRFPRGGVGLVIGASFMVFAIYYIGLIGGESLANKNIISPFWAMWADNIIFFLVGLVLISRMGHEGVTSRGGRMGEMMDAAREWFANHGRRRAGVRQQERAQA